MIIYFTIGFIFAAINIASLKNNSSLRTTSDDYFYAFIYSLFLWPIIIPFLIFVYLNKETDEQFLLRCKKQKERYNERVNRLNQFDKTK